MPLGALQGLAGALVDPVVDSASATFGVRMELQNADHSIPAGVGCKAIFRKMQLLSDAPAVGVER